jgi:hypothetical protein
MVAFKVVKANINEQHILMKGEYRKSKSLKPEAYKFVNERKNNDIALSHAQAEEYIKYHMMLNRDNERVSISVFYENYGWLSTGQFNSGDDFYIPKDGDNYNIDEGIKQNLGGIRGYAIYYY